ncbi:MAG: tetratricopeptide repeat protein [Nitrospira sp.]|nr:tetratricopeptide repeat protein [Nitrospira sp.]MBH0206038.1 tetratricopeptide repeat protein [Nitrospira sp.]
MRHQLVLVTLRMFPLLGLFSACSLFAQPSEDNPPSIIESPPPMSETVPPQEQRNRQHNLELMSPVREDATTTLQALRDAVRLAPRRAETRLKLAQGLNRIADFDAALDECRAALLLEPDNANAHLQLGIVLTAKQDWRTAASALKDAIRLNPDLAHAHYTLGSVLYALGHVKGAVQSYRRTLELRPGFPDARYRLALLLKLSNREQEATQLMEDAARDGVLPAQFFLGNAYKSGQGVEKNLSLAVFWWAQASALNYQPATDTLTKLRRQALSITVPERKRREALDAFQTYRESLWKDIPGDHRSGDETVGTSLLKENRTDEAVATLIAETYALSDVAQDALSKLYETGGEPHLARYDQSILACLETVARDGFLSAKYTVARIYAKGLGVTPDRPKAKTLLKHLPKQEAATLLREWSLH